MMIEENSFEKGLETRIKELIKEFPISKITSGKKMTNEELETLIDAYCDWTRKCTLIEEELRSNHLSYPQQSRLWDFYMLNLRSCSTALLLFLTANKLKK